MSSAIAWISGAIQQSLAHAPIDVARRISDFETPLRAESPRRRAGAAVLPDLANEPSPFNWSDSLAVGTVKPLHEAVQTGRIRDPYIGALRRPIAGQGDPLASKYRERISERYGLSPSEFEELLSLNVAGWSALPHVGGARVWSIVRRNDVLSDTLGHCRTLPQDVDLAIITGRLGLGGNEKVVSSLARTGMAKGRSVTVIVADSDVVLPECYPDVQVVALGEVRPLPEGRNQLEERARALTDLLSIMRPRRIVVTASTVAHNLLRLGQLKAPLGVGYALYSRPVTREGAYRGFILEMPLIEPHVDWFLTDNIAMRDYLRNEGVDADRITRVHVPVAEAEVRADAQRGREVLWASRLDAEKCPELLIEIARAVPKVTFRVYGTSVLDGADHAEWWDKVPNIDYRGGFESFAQLDLRDIACFLYTSLYDGRPNVVLEAMASCLPVVASDVGDLFAVLGEGRGEIVPKPATPNDFATAITCLLADPGRRRDMGAASSTYVAKRHSEAQFSQDCHSRV